MTTRILRLVLSLTVVSGFAATAYGQGATSSLSGIVRASGSNEPLSGRKVTAIELTTGARYEASTATNGGYTMKVPRGKYRLEVELRPGEVLAERPAETEINASDLDPARDFVVAVKPPGPMR